MDPYRVVVLLDDVVVESVNCFYQQTATLLIGNFSSDNHTQRYVQIA